MTLAGRRILLVGIGFYDYEQAIADELGALGAEVVHVCEEPIAPSVLHRRFGWGAEARQRAHHAAILARASTLPSLDDVLVIKGRTLTAAFLEELRSAHPGARFTAYHWDSVQRSPGFLAIAPQFDRVFTFDHRDAAALPGFLHRPLFYRSELMAIAKTVPCIELSFVGWLHHNRLAQIEAMRVTAAEQGWKFQVHLSTGRYTALREGRLAGREFVHAWPLKFSDYVKLVGSSATVLDLPHPQQSGMTMRCIEVVLGAGRKLVTTNPDCRGYDFYDPENIHIIDLNAPHIPQAFLSRPVRPLPEELTSRYSIRSWVQDLLDPERLAESPPFFREPAQGS